jgi:hypothetical protein
VAKRGERVRHLGGAGRGRWVKLERGGVAFGEHPVQRQCVKVRVVEERVLQRTSLHGSVGGATSHEAKTRSATTTTNLVIAYVGEHILGMPRSY